MDLRDAAVADALLGWSEQQGRRLEVRAAATPWAVLVVEVMSQQTQIERVAPYWRAFTDRWPSPAALATASTAELIGAWAGLGYNRRALALRAAARAIVRDHGGEVPDDVEALERLPGVGPYTARAIAVAAFGRPVAPVDVNVGRVVNRLLGGPRRPAELQAAADALVARTDPKGWVWAVMDLAATVCTRRAPRCGACPLAGACASRGTPGDAPRTQPAERFEATNRWLRGRLVARLRDVEDGGWVTFGEPVGGHSTEAVAAALAALEREGFLVRDGDRARLA